MVVYLYAFYLREQFLLILGNGATSWMMIVWMLTPTLGTIVLDRKESKGKIPRSQKRLLLPKMWFRTTHANDYKIWCMQWELRAANSEFQGMILSCLNLFKSKLESTTLVNCYKKQLLLWDKGYDNYP